MQWSMRLRSLCIPALLTFMIAGFAAFMFSQPHASFAQDSEGSPPDCPGLGDLGAWFTAENEVVIINRSSVCTYEVGTAVYKKFDAVTDHQVLFASQTDQLPPNTQRTYRQTLNPCAGQMSAFFGPVLPNLMNQRYNERLLAANHFGGTNYCLRSCDSGQLLGWVGVSSNAILQSSARIGMKITGAPPWQVEFRLTGPMTMTHIEQIDPYLFTGNTWNLSTVPVGDYTMKATYIANPGVRCDSKTIQFKVASTPLPTPTPSPTPTPVPVYRARIVLNSLVIWDANRGDGLANFDGFVRPGDTISYTLAIQNTGNMPLTNVQIVDPFSNATSFAGLSLPAPQIQPGPNGSGPIGWQIPVLQPNQRIDATFHVIVKESIRGTYTQIINNASFASNETGQQWSNTTEHIYNPDFDR